MKTKKILKPKVPIIGGNGNAFHIISACYYAARTADWTQAAIESFIQESVKGNYDHLLATVVKYFTPVKAHRHNDTMDYWVMNYMLKVSCRSITQI